jgi:hypothetical protein
MQMYVNWYDRYQRVEHEAPTIGIVLCSGKNDSMVKITLPVDNVQILTARYQPYLPTEEELRTELSRERQPRPGADVGSESTRSGPPCVRHVRARYLGQREPPACRPVEALIVGPMA